MPEDGLQLFQLQGRGDAEHALCPVEAAVRHKDMAMRIETKEIAEGLYGDDGARDGIDLRNRFLEKEFQGFPGTATEIGKKFSIEKKVTAQHLWEAENKMPVGNLLDDIHAQPLPEFHHALLMAGGAEVTALAGECEQVFMAAIFAFHTGKTFVQVTAIEITINHLLDIGPPESV